jgi:hypothetical protein
VSIEKETKESEVQKPKRKRADSNIISAKVETDELFPATQDANQVVLGGLISRRSCLITSKTSKAVYLELQLNVRLSSRKTMKLNVYVFGALAKKVDRKVPAGTMVVVTGKFGLDRQKNAVVIVHGLTKWDETYLQKGVPTSTRKKADNAVTTKKTRLYVESRVIKRGDGLF